MRGWAICVALANKIKEVINIVLGTNGGNERLQEVTNGLIILANVTNKLMG